MTTYSYSRAEPYAAIIEALGQGPDKAHQGPWPRLPSNWWQTGEPMLIIGNLLTPPVRDQDWRDYFEDTEPQHDRPYSTVLPAYIIGAVAAENPEYYGLPFARISPVLEYAWNTTMSANGPWTSVEQYARVGYSAPPDGPVPAVLRQHPKTPILADQFSATPPNARRHLDPDFLTHYRTTFTSRRYPVIEPSWADEASCAA